MYSFFSQKIKGGHFISKHENRTFYLKKWKEKFYLRRWKEKFLSQKVKRKHFILKDKMNNTKCIKIKFDKNEIFIKLQRRKLIWERQRKFGCWHLVSHIWLQQWFYFRYSNKPWMKHILLSSSDTKMYHCVKLFQHIP